MNIVSSQYMDHGKSRRVEPKIITDVDFADNIALISEDMDKANEFLLRVESAAASVGLHINEGKTKVVTLNMEDRFTSKVDLGKP